MSRNDSAKARPTAAETATYIAEATRSLRVLAVEHAELVEVAYLLGMACIAATERAKANGSDATGQQGEA